MPDTKRTLAALQTIFADGQLPGEITEQDLRDFLVSAVLQTIATTKGDLLAATAADTITRLGVGANTYVLTADSAEATGMKWAAPTGGGGTGGVTVLGYAATQTASSTISSHNTADAAITGLSVSFSLASTTVVRISGNVRAVKSSGGFVLSLYDNGSKIAPVGGWTPAPGSQPAIGWFSHHGDTSDADKAHVDFSVILSLASGSHTIVAQQSASANVNAITFYDRHLLVETIA